MSKFFSRISRSAIIPTLLLLGFTSLLISYSLLARFVPPSRKQRLGWQSWDVIQYRLGVDNEDASLSNGTSSGTGNGSETESDDTWDEGYHLPSLPLDNWDPLLPHTTGITEVTALACYLPPWLYPSLCSPPTTPEEDKLKGKWVRVDRDLNWKTGIWYLNIFYRRSRRFDVPLINSLLLLEEGSPPPSSIDLSKYKRAAGDFRSGVWPKQRALRMWYKTKEAEMLGWSKGEKTRKRADDWDDWDDKEEVGSSGVVGKEEEIITELDVLYGDGQPWFGFERVLNGPVVSAKGKRWETVDVVVRRGNPVPAYVEPPRFSKKGGLRIMQIADLHFAVNDGSCRDTPKNPCTGDPDTLELMGHALDKEKPDLVIFSGDQLNGRGSTDESYDSKSVLAKFAAPVIDRKIPWTAIFGNHDSEILEDREFQMKLYQSLPYSLAEPGPKDVDGVGNYVLKLYSGDPSRMHIFTLYFLDSHARQAKKYPWSDADYDYLKPSQIEWFLNTSNSIKPIERPFTPDGASDLDKIWRRNVPKLRLSSRKDKLLAKPNAMMFFHIPVPESYGPPIDVDQLTGDPLDVGSEMEGPFGASKTNGGFFKEGLKKAMEIPQDVIDGGGMEWAVQRTEVKVVGHGHSHNTDKCRRVSGIWMCFGGGGSYSGYGNMDFERRYRIYEISDYGETIQTWKRTESGKIVDEQILAGEGAPIHLGEDQEVEYEMDDLDMGEDVVDDMGDGMDENATRRR